MLEFAGTKAKANSFTYEAFDENVKESSKLLRKIRNLKGLRNAFSYLILIKRKNGGTEEALWMGIPCN